MAHIIRNIAILAALWATAGEMQAAEALMPLQSPWTLHAEAPAEAQATDNNPDDISIKAEGRKVHVAGAENKTLEVYNIVGVKVASYPIDAPEKTVTLNVPRGIYILRVDKVARKVNIL